MEYRAHAEHDPIMRCTRISLVSQDSGGTSAASLVDVDGSLVFVEHAPGEFVEPFLRLPQEAALALRDALNDHAPPSDDADLREALTVERERVNKIIDNALRQGAQRE